MLPSEKKMMTVIDNSPELKEPNLWQAFPGLPDLPQLGIRARVMRAEGREVADMTAGDIANTKMGLNPGFIEHHKETRFDLKRKDGTVVFPRVEGELYDGLPPRYELGFPEVMDAVAQSYGIDISKTPYKGFQTVSGRIALFMAFHGMLARCKEKYPDKKPAVILDSLAWSGYQPLFKKLGIEIIQAPANTTQGFSMSSEALKETIKMATEKGYAIAGIVPIVPSNPSGHTIDEEELTQIGNTAAESDAPLLLDVFYSALAKSGHDKAAPMGRLAERLPPEVLKYIGFLTGETKVISSNKKTGTIIWFAPKGNEEIADTIHKVAMDSIHRPTSTYPRIDEVWAQHSLHTFRGPNPDKNHIHQAMGERYTLIERNRKRIRDIFDTLGLPVVGRDSFYLIGSLSTPEGDTLIRNIDGSPVAGPIEAIERLSQYGILGAPGRLFNPTKQTQSMIRLTAASNEAELDILEQGLTQLVDDAKRTM